MPRVNTNKTRNELTFVLTHFQFTICCMDVIIIADVWTTVNQVAKYIDGVKRIQCAQRGEDTDFWVEKRKKCPSDSIQQ